MYCLRTEEAAFDWKKYFNKPTNSYSLNRSPEKLPSRKVINGKEYQSIKPRSIELPDYRSISKHTSQDSIRKSPLAAQEEDKPNTKQQTIKFPKYFMQKDIQKVERERDMRHLLYKSIKKRGKSGSHNSQLHGIKINLHSKQNRIIPMNNQRILRKMIKYPFENELDLELGRNNIKPLHSNIKLSISAIKSVRKLKKLKKNKGFWNN